LPYLEVACQSNVLTDPDEPLGRVVLVPFNGVPVIHGELVMEVVVTLANGNKSSDDVVTGSMLVIKRRLSKPMGE